MIYAIKMTSDTQGCGSGYFSTASTPSASAFTNKKRENDGGEFFKFWCVCSLPSLTLYHFEKTKIYPYIAITLGTSLKLVVLNYSVFPFFRY